jgi:hypothetical protein
MGSFWNGLFSVTAVSNYTSPFDDDFWRFFSIWGLRWTVLSEVSSNEDLISRLESLFKQKKEAIDTLNVSGHGASVGIQYLSSSFSLSTLNESQRRRLKCIMSENGIIKLWGCQTIKTKDEMALAQRMANELGVSISGSSDFLGEGPDVGHLIQNFLKMFFIPV